MLTSVEFDFIVCPKCGGIRYERIVRKLRGNGSIAKLVIECVNCGAILAFDIYDTNVSDEWEPFPVQDG